MNGAWLKKGAGFAADHFAGLSGASVAVARVGMVLGHVVFHAVRGYREAAARHRKDQEKAQSEKDKGDN
jgi:hypothetical protein